MKVPIVVVTSKIILFILTILTILLSLIIIIMTGIQSTDRKTPFYSGSLCQDSSFNDYRPFKASFQTTRGNVTMFKLCGYFPSQNKTNCNYFTVK